MPSLHEQLMREMGVPALLDAHAQRQAAGEEPPVRYYEPPFQAATMWPAAIVGKLDLETVEEYSGSQQKREQREKTTITAPTPAKPIVRTARLEIAKYPGEQFAIERFETTGSLTRLWVWRDATESIQSRSSELRT